MTASVFRRGDALFTLTALLLQLLVVSTPLFSGVNAAAASVPDNEYHRSSSSSGRVLPGQTAATEPSKTYVLFKVPTFAVGMSFPDPGFSTHTGETALMEIDEVLDFITSRYLFDFFYEYMQGLAEEDGRPLGQALHNIDVRGTLAEIDAKGNVLQGPSDNDGRRLLRVASSAASTADGDASSSPRTLSSFIGDNNYSTEPDNGGSEGSTGGKNMRYIRAVFGGTASFEDYRFDPNDFEMAAGGGRDDLLDIDQPTVRLMVMKAFRELAAYKQELRGASDHLVASVVDVAVNTNLDLNIAGGGGSGEMLDGLFSSSSSSDGSTLNKGESIAIACMALFLAGFVLFVYVYMSREYHAMEKKRAVAEGTNAALRRNADGTLEFHQDEWALMDTEEIEEEDQLDDDDGVHAADTGGGAARHAQQREVIAVPAGRYGPGSPVSRRYVQPASPFEVMYGAAFHPSEREVVQAQYEARKKRRGGGRKKNRPRAPIRPMMTLVEEEEPTAHVGELPKSSGHGILSHDPAAFKAALPRVSPTNIMKSMSTFLEGKAAVSASTSPTSVEEFAGVYRDFPRHDGTPCLMFTGDGEEWKTSFGRREEQTTMVESAPLEVGELNVEDMDDIDENNENEVGNDAEEADEGIDNFVDKLERLMTLKSRQYEERVQMEKERAARKKERDARRRKEREASSSANSTVTDSSVNSPTTPTASAEMQTEGEETKQPIQIGSVTSTDESENSLIAAEDTEPTTLEII